MRTWPGVKGVLPARSHVTGLISQSCIHILFQYICLRKTSVSDVLLSKFNVRVSPTLCEQNNGIHVVDNNVVNSFDDLFHGLTSKWATKPEPGIHLFIA